MRLALGAVVCLSACKFDPLAPATGDPDSPPGTPDGDRADAAEPDGSQVQPCSVPSATGLVACYQFDNDLTTLVDDSGNGHSMPASGFAPITRTTGAVTSQAARVGAKATAIVGQFPELELTGDFTLAAWLLPENTGTENRGVIDHDLQFALSIENGGTTCWFQRQGPLVKPDEISVENDWQLVACTLAGNQACVTVIRLAGAALRDCLTVSNPANPGIAGMSIGSFQNAGAAEQQFTGAIDDVRVYSRALSEIELCTLAGRSGC